MINPYTDVLLVSAKKAMQAIQTLFMLHKVPETCFRARSCYLVFMQNNCLTWWCSALIEHGTSTRGSDDGLLSRTGFWECREAATLKQWPKRRWMLCNCGFIASYIQSYCMVSLVRQDRLITHGCQVHRIVETPFLENETSQPLIKIVLVRH